MPRWLFTTLLASAAVGGVALAPSFLPSPRVTRPGPTTRPATATTSGDLRLAAALDQDAVLVGSDEHRFLVVTLGADADPDAARVPVDVSLIVDTSGSMSGAGKIEHARSAVRTLAGALREGDRVSLVHFGDDAQVLLPGGSFTSREALEGYSWGLTPAGSTNLSAGLEAGRSQLGDGEQLRRLLVVTDGNANRGTVDPGDLRDLVETYTRAGVTVSTVGLGADYNEVVLETLADAGGGTYTFVEDAGQLPAVVAREMDQAASTVARDVTLDVRLRPGVRVVDVHGWEATRSDGGTRVFVGEVAAGQDRKVVLELAVDPGAVGAFDVADVALAWTGATDGERHEGLALVSATATADTAVARASVDVSTQAKAYKAVSGTYARGASDKWRKGDADGARRDAEQSRSVLLQLISTEGISDADRDEATEQAGVLGALADAPAAAAPVTAKRAQTLSRGMSK